jgi:hypothetical protein
VVADRVAGLILSVGYTFAVLMAIHPDASGALQDLVTWYAWLLLCCALVSYGLSGHAILDLYGGRTENSIRYVCLVIQVFAFGWAGWWWTFIARLSTELISIHRIHHARLEG